MIRLFELRNEKSLSQRDMAKIMNIGQGTFNNWENGNTQPSIEQLIALANYFGVSVDYLIGNSDDLGVISYKSMSEENSKLISLLYNVSPQLKQAIITILTEYNNKTEN
jgi:transcriptional regulator with XRE-family HTH domain